MRVELLDFLTDISVEEYARRKAYMLSIDGTGRDDTERYFVALQRATTMLNCAVRPVLDAPLFALNLEALSNDIGRHQAVRRKAYWLYLADRSSTAISNWLKAEAFVHRFCDLCRSEGIDEDPRDVMEELRLLLRNNLVIANALDMYGFCYVRQALLAQSNL